MIESQKIFPARLKLFMLGMTAMATQVILIRESLAIFQGNELIIGLFLGIWMLLTALGAYAIVQSSKIKIQRSKIGNTSTIDNRQPTTDNEPPLLPRFQAPLLILLTLLPLTTLYLLVILRYTIVPSGVLPGLGQIAPVIFLALLPFCLVSGMIFPILVQSLSALSGKNLLYEGYALDSAGSILGGLLFSMLFILVLPPFESLLLLTMICAVTIIIWLFIIKRKMPAISLLLIVIIMIILDFRYKPASFLDKLQFNKQQIIEIKSSPYGLLAVTRIGEQFFIYENGTPVNLGDDAVSCEESVHYAMLLHPSPGKLMVISGGTSGSINEILKYPVSKVDYVETNPWLMRLAVKYRPLPDDKRVNYIFKDPRIFLSKNDEKYDVILINTPEPNSAELNRFYTVEFYKLLKNNLNPGGIISVSVPAAGNYMSETSRQMHSVNYNTLSSVFRNIRIIPGAKDYFLATDSTIEQSIFKDFQTRRIENSYINPSYINENLLKMRSELIMKDIIPKTVINSDLRPFAFHLFLRQWLERFKTNAWIIPAVLILSVMLIFIFLGPLNLGLFTGGFSASGLEFLLMIWFQVIYGFVYQMTGVIFAVFMIGIAIGSLFRQKIYKSNTFRGFLTLQVALAAFSAIIAALMLIIPTGSANKFLIALIFILLFITGLLTGIQFSLSAYLRNSEILKSSGESFSSDLLGSAIGILVVSVYLVPLVGLPVTAILLAGLNVVAVGVMILRKRSLGCH